MKIRLYGVRLIAVSILAIAPWIAFAGGNRLMHNPNDPANPVQVQWDERMMPIKWVLSRDGYAGSGITNAQIENELQAAFDTWQSINTSAITFSYQGQVDRRSAEVDGYHLITFTDPETEFPPGAVGLAVTWSFTEQTTVDSTNNDLDGDGTADIPNGVYAAGTIFDGNVVFNSSYDLSISGAHGTLDIRAVALHEIGHMIGLSHSSIPEAAMWPFQNPDVAKARSLALDDIAYVSSFYPREPEFSVLFGSISGRVTNGFDNSRIVGAHVYAVDIESGEKLVGAYTGVDGSYSLPIPSGNYFVGIEPLDGDPAALDPQRINEVIANTFDTSFSEELFDANESNIESDPLAALPVGVSAGVITPNIDIRTNTVNVPGVSRVLLPGINYFAYPVAVPAGLTAFELLQAMGDPSEINAIDRLNPRTQLFERTSYVNGIPAGIDFPIRRGEGYVVHAVKQKAVTFTGAPDCPRISLQPGLNLMGVPCPPSTYSALDLLANIGSPYEIRSVKRYNPLNSANFQVASYSGGSSSAPAGDDFPIVNGEAYFAEMVVSKNEIRVPGSANLFPPAITGISPGSGVPGEFILVTGEGFDADIQKNLITFNGVGAPIVFITPTTIAVSVPTNATSGPVKVISNGRESNTVNFVIEPRNIVEDPVAMTTAMLPGQTARGYLTSSNEQDRYTFLAAKGAVVTVRAEAVSGADLLLALEGPSGVLLISDDDSGGASNPAIRNFVLPEAGNYTVVVTSLVGSSPYDLFLDIRSTTSEPNISVLQGDAQSALAGTDLPKPLEVFVTSGIGKPLAGVAVTFTATDVELAAPSHGYSLQDAGTAVITTNSNGIATVQATTPSLSGVYDITVTVPGMEPVTMQVSATTTAVSRAIISKQVEDCGGVGCEVNQKLPNPYVIQYLDINDQPVANVLTGWKVVSGGGSLSDFSPSALGHQVTGTDGRVEVFHTLGKKLFADLNGRPTKVPLMQAVAATVAGHDAPVLFSAVSRAGPPAKIEGLNTNFSRLTYGTRSLNAIRLRVTDQFDNPVKEALIDASTSELEVTPGQLDSVPLLDYETNEDGIWVGAVSAANAVPTLDEFGNLGTPGLAAQYKVNVSHSTAGSLSYMVDVDMGPEMVTLWGQSASALISHELDQPISKIVMRYQRKDTFEDIGDGTDEDNGNWTDEQFTDLRQIPIEGVAIQFTASRLDGLSEIDAGLTPTKINGQDQITLTTNSQGIAEATVTLTEVGGAISVLGEIFTPIVAELKTDTGAVIGSAVEYPLENYNREATALLAIPVEAETTIDANLASGIDWRSLVVSLNDSVTLFSGADSTTPSLNKFPNFIQIFLDGAEQLVWPTAEILESGGFQQLKLVYKPSGSQLLNGNNTLTIQANAEDFDGTITPLNKQDSFTFGNDPAGALWAMNWELKSGLEGQSNVVAVSADSNTIDLTAYLPFDINETTPQNTQVTWTVTGTGATLAHTTTESAFGVFHNTLTTSTTAGAVHMVTAKITGSDDPAITIGAGREFGPFTVVAGAPASVDVSSASSAVLNSGVDEVLVTGTLLDSVGNPVSEGTPVAWDVGYSGSLVDVQNTVDAGGRVTAKYRSGFETLPTSVVLAAGNLSDSVTINKEVLDFDLTLSDSSFDAGEQGTVTVQLSQAPARPVEIFFNNTHGEIVGSETFQDSTATASFSVENLGAAEGSITVNVAGVVKEASYTVARDAALDSIVFDYAAIAAGTQDIYDVETLSGYVSEAVVRSTGATVYGTPGETVTLSAGGFYSQNYEPLAMFSMSGIDINAEGESVVFDSISGLEAVISGSVAWDETDSYIIPGSSMRFDGGKIVVPDDDSLDFNTDYFANIRFKVVSLQDGAVLLKKGGTDTSGYALSVVEQNGEFKLTARVSTNQGNFTVTTTQALEENTWYMAGLQLKSGVLTIGLDDQRDSVAAPGIPNNTGFASALVIGEDLQGFIDDVNIGQIDLSRGTLVLIDGESEKEITFDSEGKTTVTISGGTAGLTNLGSRVGFSIIRDGASAVREEQELWYSNVASRFTLLGSVIEDASAEQRSRRTHRMNGGVAVVDGQAMAEAIDMLKKAGKPALDAVKTATQFLFEMTSISDVWQLSKAVFLWANGRFDEVDKIELAFAGVGLTLTVVTVAVTVGSGGAASGSLAAMVSVKGALKVLKSTLKEVFQREPQEILQIGGTVARWSFNLVKNILSGSAGRENAIRQLNDFKDVFIDLIQNGSAATWNLLKSIGKSADGIKLFIEVRKIRNIPCVPSVAIPSRAEMLLARLSLLSLLAVSSAHADTPYCWPTTFLKVDEVVDSLALTPDETKNLLSIVAKLSQSSKGHLNAINIQPFTVEHLGFMVKNGQGARIETFLDNLADPRMEIRKNMKEFNFENLSRQDPNNPSGGTAFDSLVAAMKELPPVPMDDYSKAFNQLAVPNASNIRGVYGEAATFRRLKVEEIAQGSGLKADPDSLKVGEMVDYNGPGKQGVDIEGVLDEHELASVSVEIVSTSGRPLFVEVKNYTSRYSTTSLIAQTTKHFKANIIRMVSDTSTTAWKNGKPHLHYEWMGEGFVNPISGMLRTDLINARKAAVLDVCKDMISKRPLKGRVPAFDCETDITFNIVDALLYPLTTKVDESL